MAHPERGLRYLGKAVTGLALSGFLLAACQTAPAPSQTDTAATVNDTNAPDLDAKRMAKANAPCPDYSSGPGKFEPPFPSACAGLQGEEDGLRWIELTAGPEDRDSPLDGATVIVAYEGYLASTGAKFDSSYDRSEAAVFVIDQVIEGWTETLKQMTPGDEWLVYIPAELAYGDGSPSPAIPANSDLVFKIRLDGFLNAEDVANLPPAAGVSSAFWSEFLPWDGDRDGLKKLPSGLSYVVIDDAGQHGAKAKADDVVAIDYEARLQDTGELVASTWAGTAPLVVRAGDMVPGVAQMISLMGEGDVWIGRIPAAIGYGEAGLDGAVPPNADLIYVLNLIAINPEVDN